MDTEKSLDALDHRHANVLVPTQHLQQVSPWHAARTSVVQINPDPNAGDVFNVGRRYNESKKAYEDLFSLAKPALMRIAAAAGIVWNWRESGPQILQKDYVVYRAVGALRLPDGSWQPIVATKEIDLTVIEEETYEANLKKALEYASDPKKRGYLKGMAPEQWAQAQTKAALIQWRKNKLMRAETGAMLRVIRAALGMKSQYTREELEKPFIVPRIDFSPDYSDPEVRKVLIEHGVGAMAQLFGQAAPQRVAILDDRGRQTAFSAGSTPFDAPAIEAPFDDEDAGEVDEVDLDQGGVEGDETGSVDPWDALEQTADEPQAELFPDDACAECGAKLTEKVREYSIRQFGRPLCMRCQKKGGVQ